MGKNHQPARHELARVNRELGYLPLGKMKVASYAQRPLRISRVNFLVAHFDIDNLGTMEVSERDGWFFIMDGQHRWEALKRWLGDGWELQEVQCWIAQGLDEKQEAEIFLRMSDTLAISTYDKFKIAVHAGRTDETDVNQIVESNKLHVASNSIVPGSIACVGTLTKVFKRDGEIVLGSALRATRDAYGDGGLRAAVIDGMGLLFHRYNGMLAEPSVVKALSEAHGGVNGLLGMAEQLKQKTGNNKVHCVAAAAVEIINRTRRGNKLPGWWKV